MKTIKIAALFLLMTVTAGAQTLKEAIRFIEREQYGNATGILKELIKSDVKNTDVYYYYLGDIALKNEKPDSARYWFMQGVKLNENSALNYAGLGKVSFEANPTEGKANFDKAVSLAKKEARVFISIAEYYISLDKPDAAKAVEYATKAVDTDAKSLHARIILGDAWLVSGDGSKAIEQYKAAQALDPKSPLTYWKIGKIYLVAKNYDLGLQYFKDGLIADENFAPLYREMGELYYKARKFDKAIESYKQYLELRDKSDDTDFRYASFLFMNMDYANSITILNNLASKKYSNTTLYRLLAYSQYETKDYDNALKNMDIYWAKIETKRIIPQDYEYYGKILAKKGQDSLAVENLNKAIERDTARTDLYAEIANIWFSAKKYDKAAAAFSKKIEVTQSTAKSTALANDYMALGKSHMLDKNYPMADSAFSKVTDLKPDLPVGYLYRAKVNAYMDPKSEKGLAKPHYEKFIEFAKADEEKNKKDLIDAYSYLGSYYLLISKDKVKAEDAWNNVRRLDPSNAKAAEAAKMLKM